MKNDQFSITGIRILHDCMHCKVVTPGYYAFNEWCELNNEKITFQSDKGFEKSFFGKNISVQAIVGKNGSGKSSILELMYRMINNLGCLITKGTKRNGAEVLYFIDNICADMYFVIGDQTGVLSCRNKFVGFQFSKLKVYYGEKSTDKQFRNFTNYNDANNDNIKELTKYFFYTIVTNYSIQAFIGNDYRNEACNAEVANKSITSSEAIWIDSLFHKNDGYIAPIVLNPYRDKGILNLNTEYQLTNSRLASILIESNKSNKQFIDGYKLQDIEYTFNPMWMVKKYSGVNDKIKTYEDFIFDFIKFASEPKTFSNIILNAYGYKNISPKLRPEQIISYAYLVYKTLNIASKYPSYVRFEELGKIKYYYKSASEEDEKSIKELVKEILKDKSHITLKVRQTINFLYNNINLEIDKFTYTDYESKIKNKKNSHKGLYTIMEYLPPPFFNFDIKLNQVKNSKITQEGISFQKMSAGERQYIYTITTFVYHIKNILSIQQPYRIKYRHINLVLDEVEICFHPEYQRQFIHNLISTIRRLKLNTYCSFNIIIATHSPFILSDIPKSNILYLEEGKPKDKNQFENPFGANINDILKQSFFLNNGFVGEFAKLKINSLLDYLTLRRKGDWTNESAKKFITLIEDPLIKQQLRYLYIQFIDKDDVNSEIDALKEQIKCLESKQQ